MTTLGSPSLTETYSSYENMTDEAVAELARGFDGSAMEFLLNKYKNFCTVPKRVLISLSALTGKISFRKG